MSVANNPKTRWKMKELSRTETYKMLGVSQSKLYAFRKKGLLTPIKNILDGRIVRYAEAEVLVLKETFDEIRSK
jgi:predicted DNA-binding transcriptional regulator AlpA